MVHISKDDGDRILENFLISVSKENGSVECAKESIEIMSEFEDSYLIVHTLVSSSMRNKSQMSDEVINFEVDILSAITTMYSNCNESDVPVQFDNLFSGDEDEVLNKVGRNKKIHFAVRAFIDAFYTFDRFEKKYPEITKML